MANLFDLVAKLTLDSSEYESGLNSAQSKASSIGSTLKSGLGTAAKVGAAAVGAAASGIVAFGKSAVDAGMNFDSSMSQVAATMGTTVDQIGNLRDFAQQMGSTTAFSATEAADALNYMALAGYDAETSMSMLPNVLNLAAAGGIDLAAASDMVTDASSALGLSLDQTSTLVDQMAKASSMSNTSVAQLGDAILTVGGTAKNLAGGTTELSTALGILADNGIKGAEGGTALRNIILSLSAPTDQAAQKMQELGLSAYDAQGNLRPMEDIFTDLNGALSSMTQGEQTEVLNTLFNKVDLKSANALLGTSADRWKELAAGIDNASGAAQNMADTQLDNLSGDITLFKSALEGAQIAVSDVLSPALREFVQLGTSGISSVTQAFQNGGLTEAAGAAGEVIGQLVNKIVEYAPKIVEGAVTLVQSLGSALLANAPTLIDSALQIVEILVQGIVQSAPQVVTGAMQIVTALANGLGEMAPTLLTGAAELISGLLQALTDPGNLGSLLQGAMTLVQGLADGIVQALPILIAAVPQIVQNLVTTITANAPQLVASAGQIVMTLANGIIQAVPQLLSAVPTIINTVLNGIIQLAPQLLSSGLALIQNITQGLVSAIPQLMATLPQIIGQIVNTLAQLAPQLIATGIQLLGQLAAGFLQAIPTILAALPEIVDSIAQGLVSLAPQLLSAGVTLAKSAWEGIKSIFKGGDKADASENVDFSGISTKSQEAASSAASSFSTLSSTAQSTFSGMTASAQSSAQSISTAFAKITTTATNAVGTANAQAAAGLSTADAMNEKFGNAAQSAQNAATTAQTAGQTITQTFSEMGTNVGESVNSGLESVNWDSFTEGASNTVSGSVEAFSQLPPQIQAIFEMIKKYAVELHSAIKKEFTNMATDAVNAWANVPGQFNTYFTQINTNATTLATNIRTTFTQLATDATTWGQDMMTNFGGGITTGSQPVFQAVEAAAAQIKRILGFSEPEEGPLSDFHTYAPDMMKLFAQGVKENTGMLQSQVEKSFNFRDKIAQPETLTYSETGGRRGASATEKKIDELSAVVKQYLPQLANMKVVMDSGVTVGAMLPQIDSQLGQRYRVRERAGA